MTYLPRLLNNNCGHRHKNCVQWPTYNPGLAPCLQSRFEKTIFIKKINLTSEQQFIKKVGTAPSPLPLATITTPKKRSKINLQLMRYWCTFTPQTKHHEKTKYFIYRT